jgi:hypothetical protein
MFVNSGTRGNKTGLLCSLSAFPSFIKPGTRQTGLTGRFQKSFDMSSRHLLRKGKNRNERENGERILGLKTDVESVGVNFFWQRVLRKCMGVERQRKRRLERLFKSWMPIVFVKGNYFGTPLCTTCKSNEAGDKDRSLRNRGAELVRGGRGRYKA